MNKLGSWFVPYLMGLLIMFEGVALVVLAREIELVDALVLDQMMTLVLGAALIVLGLLLFVPIFPQLQKLSEVFMKRMQVVAALAVLVIALIFLLIAAPAVVEDIGTFGKNWVVLAAAQLFLLGILAFVFLYYQPLANRRLAWLEWLGMFASCLVITEGIVIFGLRGELNVHGEMETGPIFMIVIGVVLVALGIFEMVIFNRRREGESEKVLEIMDWAGLAISIVIGAIGLFGLTITTSMTLDGSVYSYYWLLLAAMTLTIVAPLLNYTQTVVAGRDGWHTDIGLITTIILLIAIPLAAAF